jgi:N6-adenosine-specific RNA methylase IME4
MQTDVVPLPDDLRDLVVTGALVWLWPVAGQMGLKRESMNEFQAELQRIRLDWSKGSAGQSQRILDAIDERMASGWSRR